MGKAKKIIKRPGGRTFVPDEIGEAFNRLMEENASILDKYDNAAQAVDAHVSKLRKKAKA